MIFSRGIHKVACAVSGGVDSAISAYLVKQRGYDVTGVFMTNWDLTNETGHCTVDADRDYAKFVCKHLDIPFLEVNFVKEYWNEVFSNLVSGYERGITPNPDVLCNKHVKFGHLFKYVTENLKVDAVATGHYARHSLGSFLEKKYSEPDVGAALLKAKDPLKDQTLFLSQIPQTALRRTMFPIGNMYKKQVKQLAHEIGLDEIAGKKESMGICFIGSRYFKDFIGEYLEPNPGCFIDYDTRDVVGRHDGVHFWTIGQRALISGQNKPFYIVGKDSTSQNIIVAKGKDHEALYNDSFTTSSPHWIREIPRELLNTGHLVCQYRFQHSDPVSQCHITLSEDGLMTVFLPEMQRAITPGQYVVLYTGEECIGSAEIVSTSTIALCKHIASKAVT